MNSEVKAKLDAVFAYPFFDSVGKPLPSGVSRVNSWPQAAKSCGFVKWSNSQLMARNALQHEVQARDLKRMQEWNPLTDELRPMILSFVDNLLTKIPLKDKNLANVRGNISWDIMLICLETEFKDIVEPIFYIPHLDPWYTVGHFPCGWDGDEFPEHWDGVIRGGQLIVF